MTELAQGMLRGLGVAGVCIGFLAAMGAFLVIAGIVTLAAITVAGKMDEAQAKREEER